MDKQGKLQWSSYLCEKGSKQEMLEFKINKCLIIYIVWIIEWGSKCNPTQDITTVELVFEQFGESTEVVHTQHL